jgi:sigma-E factor negative regulatory protein RseC
MTQIATVEKDLGGGYAEVSVPRKSACGHDCEECAGCGMTGAAIKARARNDIGAQPGDKVVVESSTKKIFGVVALVYVLPVVLFLLGYFLSEGLAEGMRYAIAVATFVVSFIPCVLYDRHARKKELLTYQIMRLF